MSLIVFAMREEGLGLFEKAGQRILYTGLGKINAAHALTRELTLLRERRALPARVLNFGTAGSPTFPTHELVECHRFVQRDMDVSPLGFPLGTTPFETHPPVMEFPKLIPWLPSGTCGSGDSFETGRPKLPCDVIDMEAFALAKVCYFEKVPFVSVKYITDGSDHNAHQDWTANLPKAAARFFETWERVERGCVEGTAGPGGAFVRRIISTIRGLRG